ncbi:MAG: LamG-like jellyroll fold domain-containing protein [Planctomycetota bacterium]
MARTAYGIARALGSMLVIGCLGAPGALAQIRWEVNNHVYEYVSTPLSWEDARAAAAAMSFEGIAGHLATVTSVGENEFLVEQFATETSPWLGGEQPAGSVEPDGGWRWITAEPFLFTAWRDGEPNNGGTGEEVLAFAAPAPDRWNDFPSRSDFLRPYLVEYDVPSPSLRRVVNGHHYRLVWDFLSWSEARDAAALLDHEGIPGHLATVTSLPENAFVSTRLGTPSAPWLGGEQPPGSVEPDGGWRWITGEPFDFTAWGPGEPNDSDVLADSEEALSYFAAFPSTWNDAPNDPAVIRPFLVEFETPLGECHSDLPGLVSWWRGEGDVLDTQGDANGAVLGATDFLLAVVGTGFTFATDQDGVEIPATPEMRITSTGFSVSLWVQGLNADQPDPIFTLIDKSHGFVDSTGWVIEGDRDTGGVRFLLGAGGGPPTDNFRTVSTIQNILDGEYHLLIGTWDGGEMKLYIDGVLHDVSTAGTVVDNARELLFGFTSGGGNAQRFFRGQIDEIQIFERALTGAEIETIYETGGAGVCFKAPLARAGDDQTVLEGFEAQLDGTASFDSEGRPLSYQWTLLAGPEVSFDATSPQPTFIAPIVPVGGATLTFQLIVFDGVLFSDPSVTNVTVKNVNGVPVADAGADQVVAEGSIVELDGTGSFDPDDEVLLYLWQQTAGPTVTLDDPTSVQPFFDVPFVGPSGATLKFVLTVTDGLDESSDSVDVNVLSANQVPIADAGPDQTVDEHSRVELDGTASTDPDGDSLCFEWVQISGPWVALCDRYSPTPSFWAPPVVQGETTLEFQLTVSDPFGARDMDTVEVTVRDANAPPDCSRARASRRVLWPPNHKMVPVRILGVKDPDDRRIAIEITGVTQDEPVTGVGKGDTGPDAVIRGRTVLLRREVDRHGNGRVYRIHFTATDRSGASCSGSVEVCVPTSWRKHEQPCIDDGQVYTSTSDS